MDSKKKNESGNPPPAPTKPLKLEEIVNEENLTNMDSDIIPREKLDGVNLSEDESIEEEMIHSGNVSDRRLFYDATDGDLWKFKSSVELVDPKLSSRVWVGVSGKSHPIQHYITMKDQNGKLSTIFFDHMGKNIVKSGIASFIQHGCPNKNWKKDGVSSTHPLHFSSTGDCLVITHILRSSEPVVLTKDMCIQFYDGAEVILHRFTKYLHNRNELLHFGENILSTNTSNHITKQEFGERWLNPPNKMFTVEDVWTLLKKKYLGC